MVQRKFSRKIFGSKRFQFKSIYFKFVVQNNYLPEKTFAQKTVKLEKKICPKKYIGKKNVSAMKKYWSQNVWGCRSISKRSDIASKNVGMANITEQLCPGKKLVSETYL